MTLQTSLTSMTMASQEQPRLLVVDDEEVTTHALKLYLTRQGYEVHMAYSGKQALEAVKTERPHLVILDLMMPDINGFEVTMRIRSEPKTYIPIIMITAQDQERKRLQSMVSGADDYIAKPVNELELLVRVQALLRTKNHIDRLWEENQKLVKNLEARNAELEQALKEVESANILKRNILNTVSHEMGTPMLQVKSAVHLLVEDVRKVVPESVPAKLATQSVGRLETVINNVVDFARSENLTVEPFNLGDSVDLAIRGIERSWAGKLHEGRIVREFDDKLVKGDRRAVARVLTLLIDNALKFDPDGHPITLLSKKEADHVRIGVQDHGIGIAEDHLDRIFEEFYQIDSSSTRRFGGSGLGLALAKLLCNRMNTTIEVKSKLGQGSTFSFTLPKAELPPS